MKPRNLLGMMLSGSTVFLDLHVKRRRNVTECGAALSLTRARLILITLPSLVTAAAVYAWHAKAPIVAETRTFNSPNGSAATHHFELLRFRYRPILVWRATVSGAHPAEIERTFGSQDFQQLQHIDWCGGSRGVLMAGVADYDAGGSRSFRIYQDFVSGTLLTTLDLSAEDVAIDSALRLCRGENNGSAVRPAAPASLR